MKIQQLSMLLYFIIITGSLVVIILVCKPKYIHRTNTKGTPVQRVIPIDSISDCERGYSGTTVTTPDLKDAALKTTPIPDFNDNFWKINESVDHDFHINYTGIDENVNNSSEHNDLWGYNTNILWNNSSYHNGEQSVYEDLTDIGERSQPRRPWSESKAMKDPVKQNYINRKNEIKWTELKILRDDQQVNSKKEVANVDEDIISKTMDVEHETSAGTECSLAKLRGETTGLDIVSEDVTNNDEIEDTGNMIDPILDHNVNMHAEHHDNSIRTGRDNPDINSVSHPTGLTTCDYEQASDSRNDDKMVRTEVTVNISGAANSREALNTKNIETTLEVENVLQAKNEEAEKSTINVNIAPENAATSNDMKKPSLIGQLSLDEHSHDKYKSQPIISEIEKPIHIELDASEDRSTISRVVNLIDAKIPDDQERGTNEYACIPQNQLPISNLKDRKHPNMYISRSEGKTIVEKTLKEQILEKRAQLRKIEPNRSSQGKCNENATDDIVEAAKNLIHVEKEKEIMIDKRKPADYGFRIKSIKDMETASFEDGDKIGIERSSKVENCCVEIVHPDVVKNEIPISYTGIEVHTQNNNKMCARAEEISNNAAEGNNSNAVARYPSLVEFSHICSPNPHEYVLQRRYNFAKKFQKFEINDKHNVNTKSDQSQPIHNIPLFISRLISPEPSNRCALGSLSTIIEEFDEYTVNNAYFLDFIKKYLKSNQVFVGPLDTLKVKKIFVYRKEKTSESADQYKYNDKINEECRNKRIGTYRDNAYLGTSNTNGIQTWLS